MDDHQQNEDETSTNTGVKSTLQNTDVGDNRSSSLKEVSDGRQSFLSERRDSDTISESEEEYLQKMLSERRGSFRPQPKDTVPYEVQPSDTLEGIAARFNILPSELKVLNKLSSRVVFPGQTIYIPEKNCPAQDHAQANASSEQNSPKPGHVERVANVDGSTGISPHSVSNNAGHKVTDDVNKESLKINSKYVTDGEGVVSGVLIVTTNHVMFDPNVSDPLVIEYGVEKYGVEGPMNFIVRAALYTDIFRIRSKDQASENVNLYHSKHHSMKKSKSHGEKLGKSEKNKAPRRYSAAESGMTISSSFQENLSKISENAIPEDESNVTIKGISHSKSATEELCDGAKNKSGKLPLSASSSLDSDDGLTSRKTSVSDEDAVAYDSPRRKSNFEKTKHKLHKGLKKLSLTDGLFHSHSARRMSLPAFTPSSDNKSKSHSVKSPLGDDKAVKSDQEKAPSGGKAYVNYVNMVDEKPELFAPVDKLIPRPATSFCDTPLYLCLRMGQPVDKSAHRGNPVVRFNQKMKPEYWFSIPKDSVDSLYNFFLRWCPEKYGEIDQIDFEELGFIPIEPENRQLSAEKAPSDHRRASWAFPWRRKSKDVTEHTSLEDWEFLDIGSGSEETVSAPDLLSPSKIFTEEQLIQLNQQLPPRAMNPWTLIYCTETHGFSLKTLYREMAKFDSPVLLAITDKNNALFGAFLSSPLKVSDHFYGTGESFLFRFSPEFKMYRWSGINNYFIKGNHDSFMVGSSEGHFGLWLDDDLFHGRTNSCHTFSNEPLCPDEDFEIRAIEAWGFV